MCRADEHRTLVLFDQGGNPIQKISAVLLAFSVFPEDQRSREQLLAVYNLENSAFWSDPEHYTESELVAALLTWSKNRTGQRFAAALTMLAYQILFHKTSENVSLYRAAKAVESAMRSARAQEERPLKQLRFQGQEIVAEGIRVPSGRREIERAYQSHQSVAHILAADFLSTNALLPMRAFERTYEMDAFLLNTICGFERVMLERQPDAFVNPWLICPALPHSIADYGAAQFDGGFIDFLKDHIS